MTEVSGFFTRLEAGFAELGVEAVHVSLQDHRFGYSRNASQLIVVRLAKWMVSKRLNALKTSRFRGQLWLPLVYISRVMLFVWALFKFDVFILGAGSSFFGMRDLLWLRFFGKKVIYTLHGTDARPPYIDGFFEPSHYGMRVDPGSIDKAENEKDRAIRFANAHAKVTLKRLRFVKQAERHANYIFCAPGYAQFLSKTFINFYAIGLPTTLPDDFESLEYKHENDYVRILHAPSYASGKGTKKIRKIINRLKERGLLINYVEVSGRPNIEVLKEISRCDLVIDQYYSDTPLSGFPSEAGMLGKPAAVGGYFSEIAREEITPAFTPPSAYCLPENLEDVVSHLVENPKERERLGRQVSGFINERWNPSQVAARILRVLNDDIPQNWTIDPSRLRYMLGIGLSKEQARANIEALIELHGVVALGLSHKPDLQKRFVAFANGEQV
ncbi:hypothetical protein N8600_00560 [Gammaproteobacteria bacterium]|nr:hypothetical protein [Gammaproteobacteria bacterium]